MTIDVAAFMSTMSFLASAATPEAPSASGREREAGKDVGLVAHDEFLRQPLCDIRVRAAGVLADDFDLLAGDSVAVLLHIELDAVIDLRGRVGELAGIGADDADLDRFLERRRPQAARPPSSKAAPASNTSVSFWSSPEHHCSLVIVRMPDLPDKEKRREPEGPRRIWLDA